MNYEFSKELVNKSSHDDLTRRTKNFINNKGIVYNGDKVYLVVDGIIVKSLDMSEEVIEVLELESDSEYSNLNFLVTIEFQDKTVTEVTLKDYLLGTLATNAYLSLEDETLKALALLYRTYAYKEMKEKGKISAINSFAIYKPISFYKLLWLSEFNNIYKRLEDSVDSTDREFVTWNDEYVLPFIHISNNGYTTDSDEYDYLKKKASLWDYTSPYYLDIQEFGYEELCDIFNCSREDIQNLTILEVTNNNRIKKVKIGNHTYSGVAFKNILSLKSDDVTILIDNKRIRFVTRGYGNSLGISQFGANEMAKAGYLYSQLINYYFTDIKLKRYV